MDTAHGTVARSADRLAERGPTWTERVWWWGPAVALMALIFALSSFHRLPAAPGGLSDKHVHAIAYGVLAASWCRALVRGRLWALTARHFAIALAVSVLYGITDEWHQSFVPGRTSDVLDVVADGVGALVAVIACGIIGRFLRGRLTVQ